MRRFLNLRTLILLLLLVMVTTAIVAAPLSVGAQTGTGGSGDDDDDDDIPPPNEPSCQNPEPVSDLYGFEGGDVLGADILCGFHEYIIDTIARWNVTCDQVAVYKVSDQGGILDLWDAHYFCEFDGEGNLRYLHLFTAGRGTYVFFLVDPGVVPPLRLSPTVRLLGAEEQELS
ncbi:MAG: hypothetical protein H7175_25665 [Burkholderiales bacterium]|nr:hypothetical protein [Anaerolineae bacterium]